MNYEEITLNDSTDAKVWADEFVRQHGGDRELMLAWFANAIMAGHDAAIKNVRKKLEEKGIL